MFKKIISFLIAFSMLFSIISFTNARNIELPQNYRYLSKEAKIQVLERLISEVQALIEERMEVMRNNITEKESRKILPLETRVMLKSIENMDVDLTETGVINFNFESNAKSKKNYNGYPQKIKINLKDLKYKISQKDNKEEFDFHISGKYSLDVDFMENNKIENTTVENDEFSIDVVYKKDRIFVKIDGFKKSIDDALKELKYTDEKNAKELKNMFNYFLGKWVEIPLENFVNPEEIKYYKKEQKEVFEKIKNILIKNYTENPFMSFSDICKKSVLRGAICNYDTKIDFNLLKNFIYYATIDSAKIKGNEMSYNNKTEFNNDLNKLISFIKNETRFNFDFTINDNEEIIGEGVNLKIDVNKNDIRKYLDKTELEEYDNTVDAFNVNVNLNSKSEIIYKSEIRNVKKDLDFEDLSMLAYGLFFSIMSTANQ